MKVKKKYLFQAAGNLEEKEIQVDIERLIPKDGCSRDMLEKLLFPEYRVTRHPTFYKIWDEGLRLQCEATDKYSDIVKNYLNVSMTELSEALKELASDPSTIKSSLTINKATAVGFYRPWAPVTAKHIESLDKYLLDVNDVKDALDVEFKGDNINASIEHFTRMYIRDREGKVYQDNKKRVEQQLVYKAMIDVRLNEIAELLQKLITVN